MLIGIDGNEANVQQRVGSGQYGYQVLCHLAKIIDRDQIEVFLKEEPLADLPPSLQYRVFGPKKFWTQLALPVNLFFKVPRPDVFFTPTHYAPRFSPVPVVVTIFDLSFLHFPDMFQTSDLLQLVSWTRYSILKAVKILTISHFSKKEIVKNYPVPANKVVVTYPGVGAQFVPQTRSQIAKVKRKYQIETDYILYVGTLQPRKNLERLIEAFRIIIRDRDGAKRRLRQTSRRNSSQPLSLVIAGKKGWLFKTIFQKVKDLGLVNKVIFTDFVQANDLPALISGAKVYVLPSLYEGFGLPVVEAQSCGVPVVVANNSSLPEIVGKSGVLVDPLSVDSIYEGIKLVLEDNSLRDKLIKEGFKNCERFSWAKTAAETLRVLKSAAA